jgi:hypothetical protein
MRLSPLFLTSAFCLLLLSCGKSESPPAASAASVSPAASADSSTPANAPASGNIVKLDAGADLSRVQNQQIIHPQFFLTPPEVESPLIFAHIHTDADSGPPAILKKIGATWRIVQLDEAVHQEWVYAAACPPRQEIWAILDLAGDAKAWQLTLLRSTDNGLSWQFFSAVKKPSNAAIYAGFALAKNGQGRLSMHLEEETDGHPKGYYHYRTTDGGKTWAGPTAEPNHVEEADTFEPTDSLPDAIKKVESIPHQP